MRNFVPCATNHVVMFSFVVLSTDDLFIYTYNDIHKMKVAINVEVTMTMKEDTIERR